MANLTAALDSAIQNQSAEQEYLVADSQTFYAGGLVQLDANGKAIPLSAASTRKCVGQFVRLSPDGTKALVREGDIVLNNASSTDAIVQANAGADVYAADDNTVSDNSTDGASPPVSRPKVGKFIRFDGTKIVVRCNLSTT